MAEQIKKNGLFSRRSLLKGTASVAGGLALTGTVNFANVLGVSAQEAGDDPQTILNLAATAETLAVTFYYNALTAAQFDVDDDDVVYLKFALDAEKYHLDFLMSNGGMSLTNQFYVPSTLLSDPSVFIKVGTDAETAFVGAYLAATRRFAELGASTLAATTAQHACSEAQHLALIRDIGGLVPNNLALPLPIYYNVSNAVPTLAPFLQGGSGFIGPVTAPTAAQITAVLGGIKSDSTKPYAAAY
jgi:Ferritin-like domain